jgi:hypothetical protein
MGNGPRPCLEWIGEAAIHGPVNQADWFTIGE